MNNLVLSGRVTKKPEMKTSSNGKNYCFLSIACQESKEVVNFFETTLFGTNAENAVKYLDKGDLVGLTGSLCNYKGKDGKVRLTINTFRMEFLARATRKQEQAQ